MNQDNSITVQTKLFGFLSENAQNNRFSNLINKLFKENNIDAMMIPMNIRSDDFMFTLSQMRSSKLGGAVLGSEFQEEAFSIVDAKTSEAENNGYCDTVYVVDGQLIGDLIINRALERYAESSQFEADIALMSQVNYFFDIIKESTNE